MSEEITPANAEEEFEEISSEEVDRVVAALEELIETVESDNIRIQLEDASNNIFYLVYDESDLEDADVAENEGPTAEAA